MYSLSGGKFFDPTELAEAITPQAARQALSQHHYVKALLLAMRLKDTQMLENILLSVPDKQVRHPALRAYLVPCIAYALPVRVDMCNYGCQVGYTAAAVPPSAVTMLLVVLAGSLPSSPHLEFMLSWLRALCLHHGDVLQSGGGAMHAGNASDKSAPALRTVQQAVTALHDDIRTSAEENLYMLRFLCSSPTKN